MIGVTPGVDLAVLTGEASGIRGAYGRRHAQSFLLQLVDGEQGNFAISCYTRRGRARTS